MVAERSFSERTELRRDVQMPDLKDNRYMIYGTEDRQSDGISSEKYKGYTKHKVMFLVAVIVVLIGLLLLSVSIGPIQISFSEIIKDIITFNTEGNGRIIWNVRFVRVIGAVLVGAGLAVSGVVMQCILRNPLASPYTLGISNAAAFGAAFSIVFVGTGSMMTSSISIDDPFMTTAFSFVFSMVATVIILMLTKITHATAETMVLAGIAITAIFSAALSLTQYMATDAQLANIVSWMFGDVGRASWSWNLFIFSVLLPISMYFIYKRWDYNAIDAGEETAKGLGVNTEKERIVGMVLASVLCSVIVSFFGIIAFVGLLAPHIARMIVGGDHRYLIPASMVIGSIILVLSDLVGKQILAPEVIPVGIITSLLGGPIFIYLLIKRYR